MSSFYFFFLIIVIQRLAELLIAKRNEKWMKEKGAIEFNQGHYPIIVFIHSLFFIALFLEVLIGNKQNSSIWFPLIGLFAITQLIRFWVIASLGKYWNTKIIILPDAPVVKKGPYRFLKHPNYLIVSIEFIIIPLLFDAYLTAIVFSLLNGMILAIRIPAEEKALNQLTEYDLSFFQNKRYK